jgi:hypothetical protein
MREQRKCGLRILEDGGWIAKNDDSDTLENPLRHESYIFKVQSSIMVLFVCSMLAHRFNLTSLQVEMSDPLSLLRQATIAGKVVASESGKYIFGSVRLPEQTSTCFRRSLKGLFWSFRSLTLVPF